MIRKAGLALLSSILGCGLAAAAHASPISAGTYNVTNTTVSAGNATYSFSGTLTLNSSGLITAADITLNDSALGNPVFNTVSSVGGPAGYQPTADFAYLTNSNNVGQLYVSYLTTLDGSGNIDLCVESAGNCNSYQDSYSHMYGMTAFGYNNVNLNSGSLDPSSTGVTPEPPSLLLLATGLLGLAALVHRRMA